MKKISLKTDQIDQSTTNQGSLKLPNIQRDTVRHIIPQSTNRIARRKSVSDESKPQIQPTQNNNSYAQRQPITGQTSKYTLNQQKPPLTNKTMITSDQNQMSSGNQSGQTQASEIKDEKIRKVTKPKEMNFHTNKRIEHRKECINAKQKEKILMEKVNYHIYRIILCYAASSYSDVYKMMKVCKRFYQTIMSSYDIWYCVLKTLPKQSMVEFSKKNLSTDEREKAQAIKGFVELEEQKRVIKSYETFFADYRKLFEYCSTKENLGNKLLERMKLRASVRINNKLYIADKRFELRKDNFGSHILIKMEEVQKVNILQSDKMQIQITFFSRDLNTQISVERTFKVNEILDSSVRQKAFCYYADRNFLICYFEGDSSFLYSLFEISAIELISRFRSELQQRLVYKRKASLAVQSSKAYTQAIQRDMTTFEYDNFEQYIRYQSDFELILKVHSSTSTNHLNRKDTSKQKNNYQSIHNFNYSFIDTRCFPKSIASSEAIFILTPKDAFQTDSVFLLDNKAGMQEPVHDLLLLDLILKDRDRFLICFSGFVTIQNISESAHKNSIAMNLQHSEADSYQAKRISFSQKNSYSFELLIVQTQREAILQQITVQIMSSIISLNLQ